MASPRACNRTVLVVDDDRDVLDAVVDVLTDHEFVPVSALNGEEALQRLRSMIAAPPCVILLDIMMPVMDAWQFRAVQTQDPVLDAIPVVVSSAHADVRQAATDMKVAGYMKKPFNLDVLLSTLEKFCDPLPRA